VQVASGKEELMVHVFWDRHHVQVKVQIKVQNQRNRRTPT
jgi:hypothetical protein